MDNKIVLPEDALKKLSDTLSKVDIVLSPEQMEKLLSYYELLVERNRVMNLTAITEFDEVAVRHYADSLIPLSIDGISEMFSNPEGTILDLGTGAGFPGLPLAIALPDVQVTLADALQKRTNFLEEVKNALSLDNVTIVNGRAEELGRIPEYRESFDIVVSRAVAEYRVLCEYCLPFVKVNGIFAAWKGPAAPEEIKNAEKALDILGGNNPEIKKYILPDTAETRVVVITKKRESTAEKYPRRAGIPSKRPL